MSLHDRIILPRSVYEKKKSLPDPSEVNKHIAKGFEILEEDPSVSEFGITKKLDDPTPIAAIPRHDFLILTKYATVEALEENGRDRIIDQREKFIVLKAILARSARKWQFVWNGIKISAAISDENFYESLARHEYEFGKGDIIDATLRIFQRKDDETGVYIYTRYEVIKVHRRIPGPRQDSLFSPR